MKFGEYLRQKHMDLYPQVPDDDLPDHFERWVSALDGDTLIEYADEAIEAAVLIRGQC